MINMTISRSTGSLGASSLQHASVLEDVTSAFQDHMQKSIISARALTKIPN
jgi:hypothetical protein